MLVLFFFSESASPLSDTKVFSTTSTPKSPVLASETVFFCYPVLFSLIVFLVLFFLGESASPLRYKGIFYNINIEASSIGLRNNILLLPTFFPMSFWDIGGRREYRWGKWDSSKLIAKQQTTEYELGLNTDSWVTMMVSKNTHEWIISALAGRILDPKDNVSKHSIFIVNGSMGPIMCSIFWRIFFPNPLGSRELVSPFLFLNESTRVYLPGKLAKTKWVGKYVTATMENLIILPPLSCCC